MSQSQNKPSSQLLASLTKQSPIRKLRIFALIIVVLIFVMLGLNIAIYVYTEKNPDPPINSSFVNQIILQTQVISTGTQVRYMLNNIIKANPNFYFQHAEIMVFGNGNNFTQAIIEDQILRKKASKLLFIFQVRDSTLNTSDKHSFAVYIAPTFILPRKEDFVPSLQYYTFEHTEIRQSMLLSLQKPLYLLMNKTTEQTTLLECKTITLHEATNSFGLLSIIKTTLDEHPYFSLINIEKSYECFDGVTTKMDLVNKLDQIVGFSVESDIIQIEKYEVYHLS